MTHSLFCKKRCALTADGKKVVADTDQSAATLLAVPGAAISSVTLRGVTGVEEFFQETPLPQEQQKPHVPGPLVTIDRVGEKKDSKPVEPDPAKNTENQPPGAGNQPSAKVAKTPKPPKSDKSKKSSRS